MISLNATNHLLSKISIETLTLSRLQTEMSTATSTATSTNNRGCERMYLKREAALEAARGTVKNNHKQAVPVPVPATDPTSKNTLSGL